MQILIKNQFLNQLRMIIFGNRFLSYPEYRLKKYILKISKSVLPGSKILDAGAGECRHKKYFTQANYVSQDLCIGDARWDFSQVDIKSEIYSMPVANESFDYILCTEVMEHLKYPALAFKEFQRILKKGGKLYVVCPLTFAEHQQPHDYFRYTQFALKLLAEENGFTIEAMEKEGGRFIVLSQSLVELIPTLLIERKLVFWGYFFKVLLLPISFPLAVLLYCLDGLDKEKNLTIQYECIFIKN
jgi:ubiquinone/menaquinone biosynthesis C-methylase UbiE